MSFTHTLSISLQSDSPPVTGSYTETGTAEFQESFTVAGSVTNQAVVIAFTRARLQSIVLLSDQDVTIKTNSSGSPTDTIALKAGKPYVWVQDSYFAQPLTGDVTSMFVTNAGLVTANVSIRVLINSTP